MNCHQCSQEIKLWQTFCSYCGTRLQKKSFSTIIEIPVPSEPRSRRQLLRKTLQFTILALAIIVLAGVIRLSPPQANPVIKEAAAPATASPSPVPTPELAAVTPPAVATPPSTPMTKSEAPLQPIDLLTDVFEFRATAKSSLPKPRQISAESKKATPELPSIDEAPAKKLVMPVGSPRPVVPETNPPAPNPVEAVANLEVEAGQTLLQPNIGLVSIKSYVPARVYIDGVYSGVTPRSVKLLAGEHSINLLANGYQDYTRTIKVTGQQQIGILASMSKK